MWKILAFGTGPICSVSHLKVLLTLVALSNFLNLQLEKSEPLPKRDSADETMSTRKQSIWGMSGIPNPRLAVGHIELLDKFEETIWNVKYPDRPLTDAHIATLFAQKHRDDFSLWYYTKTSVVPYTLSVVPRLVTMYRERNTPAVLKLREWLKGGGNTEATEFVGAFRRYFEGLSKQEAAATKSPELKRGEDAAAAKIPDLKRPGDGWPRTPMAKRAMLKSVKDGWTREAAEKETKAEDIEADEEMMCLQKEYCTIEMPKHADWEMVEPETCT
ncbi:hypothetical protein QBC34DRAFT_399965, partial [Podospora aff. communis PSN243]